MINVRMPSELLEKLDRSIAQGERSSFIIAAIEEKLEWEQLIDSVKKMAGMLSEDEVPYWSTSEKTIDWVQEQRSIQAHKGINPSE